MDTRKSIVIDISDRRYSGDAAYGRALASFGRRPLRSSIKLVGFASLMCGVAAAQAMASNPFPTPASTRIMIPIFFALAAVGLGLWLYDSICKHPQVYANILKAIGILLVIGYVAHRIREHEVNVIADGVNRAEGRRHDGW